MEELNNVVELVPNEVNEGVVELLEDLLAKAKSGEIYSIAGITGTLSGAFGEYYSDTALEEAIPFISYLRVLQMRFERQVEFEDE